MRRRVTSFTLAASAIVASLVAAGAGGADDANWPRWRGPSGAGTSADASLPMDWSPTSRVGWKTALPGRAHSSPIVWGDRLFVTTAIAGEPVPGHEPLPHTLGGQPFRHPDATDGNLRHTLQVLAIDAASGRVLWTKTAYEGPVYDDRHRKSSYAAHTPATDGTLVYAYFGSEGLYAYRFDGELAWSRDLGDIAGVSVGLGTSPILYEGLVIVQADEDEGKTSFIVALDKATGAEVWRTPRTTGVTWSTPVVALAGGRAQLVTTANEQIIAYDPATGRELWRERGLGSNAIPSPVLAGNLAIVSTGYPRKRTMAIRLDGPADGSRIVWQYEKGTAYVTSPIAYGDYIYLSTDNGILTCLDVATGAVVYQGGRPPVPATFMASPVAYRDHLFMTSEDGQTFVIKAGPAHEIVRVNSVDEPVFASPALSGGTVYIRGERHLFAIR